jgi:hypothetical protein
VYHEQVRTGQQGKEIETNISKKVDLIPVLLLEIESFGNKTSGIYDPNTELHYVFQKLLFFV